MLSLFDEPEVSLIANACELPSKADVSKHFSELTHQLERFSSGELFDFFR